MNWSGWVSIGSPLVVGVLAFLGTQLGVRKQLLAARQSAEQSIEVEHRQWLRDHADRAHVDALTFISECIRSLIIAIETIDDLKHQKSRIWPANRWPQEDSQERIKSALAIATKLRIYATSDVQKAFSHCWEGFFLITSQAQAKDAPYFNQKDGLERLRADTREMLKGLTMATAKLEAIIRRDTQFWLPPMRGTKVVVPDKPELSKAEGSASAGQHLSPVRWSAESDVFSSGPDALQIAACPRLPKKAKLSDGYSRSLLTSGNSCRGAFVRANVAVQHSHGFL